VDGRGDKLCGDGESLLSVFSFSQIQVPQGWMEGNYVHLKIPEGADKKDIWDRVIVPSVMRKY
jgi:hypothetical protein